MKESDKKIIIMNPDDFKISTQIDTYRVSTTFAIVRNHMDGSDLHIQMDSKQWSFYKNVARSKYMVMQCRFKQNSLSWDGKYIPCFYFLNYVSKDTENRIKLEYPEYFI